MGRGQGGACGRCPGVQASKAFPCRFRRQGARMLPGRAAADRGAAVEGRPGGAVPRTQRREVENREKGRCLGCAVRCKRGLGAELGGGSRPGGAGACAVPAVRAAGVLGRHTPADACSVFEACGRGGGFKKVWSKQHAWACCVASGGRVGLKRPSPTARGLARLPGAAAMRPQGSGGLHRASLLRSRVQSAKAAGRLRTSAAWAARCDPTLGGGQGCAQGGGQEMRGGGGWGWGKGLAQRRPAGANSVLGLLQPPLQSARMIYVCWGQQSHLGRQAAGCIVGQRPVGGAAGGWRAEKPAASGHAALRQS